MNPAERSSAQSRIFDSLTRSGCRPKTTGQNRLQSLCPAHEDKQPSLSVSPRDDRRGVVLFCHAGCSVEDVLSALDLGMGDLFDSELGSSGVSTADREVHYRYTDESNELLFEVIRRPDKRFLQRRPNVEGGWSWKLDETRRVLYRLPELLRAVAEQRPVYVVEGEKDADRLHAMGLAATCNPGGAGKWKDEYGSYLVGADVTVVADRDDVGRAHAEAVLRSLDGRARTVVLAEAAHGKDVSEHLDYGLTVEQLVASPGDDMTATPALKPGEIESKYVPVDWAELFARQRSEEVNWLCEPVLEVGRVTALFSKPKAGKSLLTLDMVAGLAAGRSVLGQPARARTSVLYVDLENSEDDVWERLRDMGYGAEDLSGWLHYYSFPDLPALDSPEGGRDLLQLARLHNAELIVIDTTSRVIVGPEDHADTFRALYRHALMPLKRDGRAVLRLDHTGKDPAAGQRGSSAKNDAEDYVWFLVSKPAGRVELRRTHSRTRHGVDALVLRRESQPHLVHLREGDDVALDERGLVQLLDDLNVPADWGRERAKKVLTAAGHRVGNNPLSAALRARKDRDAPAASTVGAPSSLRVLTELRDEFGSSSTPRAAEARNLSGTGCGQASEGHTDLSCPSPFIGEDRTGEVDGQIATGAAWRGAQ